MKRLSRLTKILISVLSTLILCASETVGVLAYDEYTPITTGQEIKIEPIEDRSISSSPKSSYVYVRFLQDITYRNNMGNLTSSYINNFCYPFTQKWGLNFSCSVVDVNNTILSNCTTATTSSLCSCSSDSNCTNATTTQYHHTNAIKNLNKLINDLNPSGYDIFVTLASTNLCMILNGSHAGVGGASFVSGDWSMCKNATTLSTTVNVRIMQHEVSHLYGCNDGVCSSGASCIMNGGYDYSPLTTQDIWCANCKTYFDTSLH